MDRITIRPRVQRPLSVVLFTLWGLLGLVYFTPGNSLSRGDWFGIALGAVMVAVGVVGVVGVWRALRVGLVIGRDGVRVHNFDSRDQVLAWGDVEAVEVVQVGERAGMPLFAPVMRLSTGDILPLSGFGTYSRPGAGRRATQIRSLKPP